MQPGEGSGGPDGLPVATSGRVRAGPGRRRARTTWLRHPFRREKRNPRVFAAYLAAVAVVVAARPTPASLAAGALLLAAGGGLRFWAAGHLSKNVALTVSGPYAHLRHPFYAGALLMGAGVAIAAGPIVALATVPLALGFFFAYYAPYKERVEAERLERMHGDAFRAYRAAVPALVPRVKPWRGSGADGAPRWRLSQALANNEHSVLLFALAALAVIAWRLPGS